MNENIKIIVSIIGVSIPLISTLISMIIRMLNIKNKNKVLKQVDFITKELTNCVVEAEKFLNFTGKEKKVFALTKLNQLCIDNGIKYDVNIAEKLLEEIVKTTKQVNKREKDKSVFTGELK